MIGSNSHKATVLAYERGYRVNENGDVVAPNGKLRVVTFKARAGGHGTPYGRFSLKVADRWASVQVHKLAAYQMWGDAAFEPGVHVRHLNGCSTDNRPANLGLGTQSENMLDRSPEDLKAHALKAAAAKRKLTPEQVAELVAMRNAGATGKQCAEAFGVRESTVSEVMSGKLYSDLTGIPFAARKNRRAA